VKASGRRIGLSYHPAMATAAPDSVAAFAAGLSEVGYLPGESTALVAYLATKLGKPILVEGPAGVGKTVLAKALA
jgi:MoxR-like ATPase